MTTALLTAAVMALPVTLAVALIGVCMLHDRWCQRQPISPAVTAWEAETEESIVEALALLDDEDEDDGLAADLEWTPESGETDAYGALAHEEASRADWSVPDRWNRGSGR